MSLRKKKTKKPRKDPNIAYNITGFLNYFNARYPRRGHDHREFGWNLGRQLVAQYLAEILLKCAYAKLHNDTFPYTQNLAYLFQKLPNSKRRVVEKKYKYLLNSEVEWTFELFETVESFLAFLGDNPITETRYYCDIHNSSNTIGVHGFQGLKDPDGHRPLIYALYIVLHGYPAPLTRKALRHENHVSQKYAEYLRQKFTVFQTSEPRRKISRFGNQNSSRLRRPTG